MWVHHLATLRSFEIETASDHLPLYIVYAISHYIPKPLPQQVQPMPKRLDILSTHEPTVVKYNTLLQQTVDTNPSADKVSPYRCGDIIAAVCRASVEAVSSLSPHTFHLTLNEAHLPEAPEGSSIKRECPLKLVFVNPTCTSIL
jgi:hypothetical protein